MMIHETNKYTQNYITNNEMRQSSWITRLTNSNATEMEDLEEYFLKSNSICNIHRLELAYD